VFAHGGGFNVMMNRRSVRSFVRRAGRTTAAQQRALARLWSRFGVDFSPAPLDLDAIHGRQADRVLEIGFGDGEALIDQAVANPTLDYLGIEVYNPGIGHCLLHAEARNVTNLRLICHDAIEVLQLQVGDSALHRINVYFPDPWPKKRHHKRRLLQPDFLELAASRLAEHGSLHVATDWQDYAGHIDAAVAACPSFSVAVRREHGGDQPLDRPVTKFERRGLKLGHRIFDWRLVRNSPSAASPADDPA
jgi:tRNA (guanine-N7-)-methyltransferase